MGYNLRKKRGSRGLVDFQGSPLSNSRRVHPDEQEVKQMWQEADMDEENGPGKIDMKSTDTRGRSMDQVTQEECYLCMQGRSVFDNHRLPRHTEYLAQ